MSTIPISNLEKTQSQAVSVTQQSTDQAEKIKSPGNVKQTDAQTAVAMLPVQDVQKITEHLNELMQNLNLRINFEVSSNTGQVVIKVTDSKTNEIIRQMPSEEAMRLQKVVDKLQGVILSTQA